MFFPTPSNCELEYMYSSVEEGIFFTENKVRRRNNLAIIRMPFWRILRILEAKVSKNWLSNIPLHSSDDAILVQQKTKITTCDVPGCVAGASKVQTTYENISFKSCFLSWNKPVFFFLETIIWIKQIHVFKLLVSALVYRSRKLMTIYL